MEDYERGSHEGTERIHAHRRHIESHIDETLEDRGACAAVTVGEAQTPVVQYCLSALEDHPTHDQTQVVALGYDGTEWAVFGDNGAHPATALGDALVDQYGERTVLTPATIPHDAALHLEAAGLTLASSDVCDRARAVKTARERPSIETAQVAAREGLQRGAAIIAGATVTDGCLERDGTPVTAQSLRVAIDEAIVSAGGFPAGNSTVKQGQAQTPTQALEPGEPLTVIVQPRGPAGYYGRLIRTFVVDSDGGRERRAHVALTQAFRSSQSMLTAGPESIRAVEADLEAEIRAFGEDGEIETRVAGIGLEPAERPRAGADSIEPGSLVCLEAAVELADGQWLRLADVLAKEEEGVSWIGAPSRSLEPAALLE
ncbi:M24 family metallopeptidase [Natronolimnobius sp. AArcel1]|uniref:M24 family metallopeptidase n=1 Tax=Natronolimnobius sp. AArcel1 TaxID=1679093 RepID=UPI0013ECBF05|nr:M24 family metallopeptidase [Natronolimnobius sp. AArcel1]NGM68182.1 M24 family metallopeptidase [Natronolimnobius sp. AArcel1]